MIRNEIIVSSLRETCCAPAFAGVVPTDVETLVDVPIVVGVADVLSDAFELAFSRSAVLEGIVVLGSSGAAVLGIMVITGA